MVRKCQNCKTRKGMTRFEGETFVINHAGMTATVKRLSGWRCGACGEVEFDAESARRYAAAGDELVMRDRERQSKEIRRIRRKLGLSQVAAGRLTGGAIMRSLAMSVERLFPCQRSSIYSGYWTSTPSY